MKRYHLLTVLYVGALASAASGAFAKSTPLPPAAPSEGRPATVDQVVGSIKQDLLVYQAYNAQVAAAAPLGGACHGDIGFDIYSVKVALTTSTDNTLSGTGAATVPVLPVTIGPNIGGSSETKGTETLTFSFYPEKQVFSGVMRPAMPPLADPSKYPISAALERLRLGLLEASEETPCISLTPPPVDGKVTDPGETLSFGFTVTNQATVGVKLQFILFSIGATGTTQSQAANTITVTFKARPGEGAGAI